jgi:hypothetical protein
MTPLPSVQMLPKHAWKSFFGRQLISTAHGVLHTEDIEVLGCLFSNSLYHSDRVAPKNMKSPAPKTFLLGSCQEAWYTPGMPAYFLI